jgi:putative oxidoreductase
MGPLLLVARLLTTGTFVFYILNELAKIHPLGLLLYVAIAAQVLGIALVALGYKTRFAAILLAVCILATLLFFRGELGFHNFLVTIAEKVLAITGGFLFMFAYGPGPISVDRLQGNDKPTGIANNSAVMGPLLLGGRMLTVFVFFFFGVSKILHTPEIKAYMVKHNAHVPTNLVYLAIVTQIVPPPARVVRLQDTVRRAGSRGLLHYRAVTVPFGLRKSLRGGALFPGFRDHRRAPVYVRAGTGPAFCGRTARKRPDCLNKGSAIRERISKST